MLNTWNIYISFIIKHDNYGVRSKPNFVKEEQNPDNFDLKAYTTQMD